MSRLRLITFDVFDTIIKTKVPIGEMYASTAKIFNLNVDPDVVSKEFPKVFKEYWQEQPNFGYEKGLSSVQWWKDVVKTTLKRSGLEKADAPNLDSAALLLFQMYKSAAAWELKPGSFEVLKELRRCYKLGVISNFDERVNEILFRVGVGHLFDVIVASKEAGVCKPDQRIFDIALERSGLNDPSQALHIGDSFKLDFLAAKNAGWKAVWLCNSPPMETSSTDKDEIVTNITQITKLPLLHLTKPGCW